MLNFVDVLTYWVFIRCFRMTMNHCYWVVLNAAQVVSGLLTCCRHNNRPPTLTLSCQSVCYRKSLRCFSRYKTISPLPPSCTPLMLAACAGSNHCNDMLLSSCSMTWPTHIVRHGTICLEVLRFTNATLTASVLQKPTLDERLRRPSSVNASSGICAASWAAYHTVPSTCFPAKNCCVWTVPSQSVIKWDSIS